MKIPPFDKYMRMVVLLNTIADIKHHNANSSKLATQHANELLDYIDERKNIDEFIREIKFQQQNEM